MTIRSLYTLAILLSVSLCLLLQPGATDETFQLPPDDFAPGWMQAGKTRSFSKADLFNYIDGGAELFLEFGFQEVLVQRYTNAATELILEVYEMQGAAAALGIFLQKRGKETPIPGIPLKTSGDRFQIIARKGRYFIQVYNSSGNANHIPVIIAMLNRVAASIAEEYESTPLDLLPEENRIKGSELLIHGPYSLQNIFTLGDGDILSLGEKLWAASADYRSRDTTYTLLLVPYDNAGAASAAFNHLCANLDPYLKIIHRGEKEITFSDYQNEFGRVELKGEQLLIRLHLKEIAGN